MNNAGPASAAPPAGANISHSPDIELGVNMGKSRPNYVAPNVVKPPTVDWLGFTDNVSASIAVTNELQINHQHHRQKHLDELVASSTSNSLVPGYSDSVRVLL